MAMHLNPYLSFRGDAAAAMEFYQHVLGGTLDIMRYGAMPGMMGDASEAEKVMHGYLETDDGFELMAADIPAAMPDAQDSTVGGTAICIWGDDADRMQGYWDAFANGGTVNQPFDPAPWGGRYGDVTDRFGVRWMFNLGTDQGMQEGAQ